MKEAEEQKSRNKEWRRNDYYKICTLGGMLSAGTTHLLITPLDVLKVNMQVVLLSVCICVCISSFLFGRICFALHFNDPLVIDPHFEFY